VAFAKGQETSKFHPNPAVTDAEREVAKQYAYYGIGQYYRCEGDNQDREAIAAFIQ
jgi:hypothetical protein